MGLQASFTFHPIGQGCFYTGRVGHKGTGAFNFVYDCGTYSHHARIDAAIEAYKQEIAHELDLLIISHFDNDHVNKVTALLKHVHCRRLIIPYYNPIERLFLFASSGVEDDEYRRMLQNPQNYFSDFNIDEIIVIGAPEEDSSFDNTINGIFPPGDRPPYIDESPDTDAWPFKDIYDEEASASFRATLSVREQGSANKVKFILIPYRFTIGIAAWEFAFYLKKADEHDGIIGFTAAVNTLIKEFCFGSMDNIYNLFEPEALKAIKSRYKTYIGGTMNSTSLVTYHGPAFQLEDSRFEVLSNLLNKEKKYSTLLTGDIDLDGPTKVRKAVDYFQNYLDRILCLQVPHHGSKHNWLIQPGPHALHNFKHYIINHGLGRQHHPAPEVIADIQEKCPNATISLNNEVYNFSMLFEYGILGDFSRAGKDVKHVSPLRLKKQKRDKPLF